MPNDQLESGAVQALTRFAGVDDARAKLVIKAWKAVLVDEGLAVVAGEERVTTTVGEIRIERVRRLVGELGTEPLPTPYELGVLMRITPSQARTTLRNWQARYPDEHETRMLKLAKTAKHEVGGGASPTWIIEYDDAAVFAYALDRLRRYGLEKGLSADRANLKIEIPQSTVAGGKDALAILGVT
jgi:hypothetical protein